MTEDFNLLYETLIELYGLKNVFFFDEIQNIENWELFRPTDASRKK